MQKYRASVLMAIVATVCLIMHFWTVSEAAVNDAAMHGTTETLSSYFVDWSRDTFENLQSEFWQLAVQFALIAGFFEFINVRAYEEDVEETKTKLDRLESKTDAMRSVSSAS
ncbi:MAG: hypothetical protein WKF81_12380 [Thermomicrobiales bacterium]